MPRSSPTLAELARATGVSPMTASRALNDRPGVSDAKRSEIRRAAARLGYAPNLAARKLSGAASRIFGVVTPHLESPFVSEIIAGMGPAAGESGYELLVYSLRRRDRHPPGGVTRVLEQVADGVIALLPFEFAYLHALAAARVPVVTVDQGERRARYPTVVADAYQGGLAAVRHLLSLGHRDVAFLGGDDRLASARERARAYRNALSEAGLGRSAGRMIPADFSAEGGYAATAALLRRRPRPTAIFAANDLSAFGALGALRAAGLRVPEDVSVVGFDDLPAAAHASPPLTTVRQPLHEMGREAVGLLLAGVRREVGPRHVVLPTTLVIRESTAARTPPARRRTG